MKTIRTTNGYEVLIDDEDFERVSQHKWSALVIKKKQTLYIRTNINKKLVYLHRFILNAPDGLTVDHRNHDTLDNRRENLRLCTRAQNNANKKTKRGKLKGVSFRADQPRKPFQSVIRSNGKLHHLGYYATEEEAARAYDAAAKKHFGEFAYLNFKEQTLEPQTI